VPTRAECRYTAAAFGSLLRNATVKPRPLTQSSKEEIMKKILAVLLSSWCSCALAQSAQELIDNGKNSENVTTFGMGYNLEQYSPLSQINKSSIKRLVPIWSTSLSNDTGELAQPTIYNGVMFVVNGNWTFALDVAPGQQFWRTPV
jgi:alcohol dehydrogenase (cytochrome c)